MSSDSAYPQPAARTLRVVARRPAIEDPDAAGGLRGKASGERRRVQVIARTHVIDVGGTERREGARQDVDTSPRRRRATPSNTVVATTVCSTSIWLSSLRGGRPFAENHPELQRRRRAASRVALADRSRPRPGDAHPAGGDGVRQPPPGALHARRRGAAGTEPARRLVVDAPGGVGRVQRLRPDEDLRPEGSQGHRQRRADRSDARSGQALRAQRPPRRRAADPAGGDRLPQG